MMKPDMPEFRALLDQQAEIFRTPKLSDAAILGYWTALTDVPLAVVRACAQTHLRKGKFFPKPAELRPKDWTPPAVGGEGPPDFTADLERLQGTTAAEALRDRDLRARLEAHFAHLTSGPKETPATRADFAPAYWRSVETWLEWRLEGKHAEGRTGSLV